LRIGGPATAGAAWVPQFLTYAAEHKLPVDFVATHTYGVEGGFLDEEGKQDTKLSPSPDAIVGDVRKVRGEIAASAYPEIPLFFTEWSTSYTPRDFVHDSYISAPYILSKLKGTQGLAQGMSYWTYTDLFEEPGPPPTPFHGGFGLMNREGIRKPAWFAYKYLHAVRGRRCPPPTIRRWWPGWRQGLRAALGFPAARAEGQQQAFLHAAGSGNAEPPGGADPFASESRQLSPADPPDGLSRTIRSRPISIWACPKRSAPGSLRNCSSRPPTVPSRTRCCAWAPTAMPR
jgi:hypothetical protein